MLLFEAVPEAHRLATPLAVELVGRAQLLFAARHGTARRPRLGRKASTAALAEVPLPGGVRILIRSQAHGLCTHRTHDDLAPRQLTLTTGLHRVLSCLQAVVTGVREVLLWQERGTSLRSHGHCHLEQSWQKTCWHASHLKGRKSN